MKNGLPTSKEFVKSAIFNPKVKIRKSFKGKIENV